MPQKTNLNVSPYYDDFDKADNFYKVLFKPGFPVQARELTGLQSILQNQIESFGSHMFKEGSMVIPGGITCDNAFTTVKVNGDHLGIDITVYLDAVINANNGKGSKVKGENSEIVGTIKGYLLPPEEGVEEITLFVKYQDGGVDGTSVEFEDGEVLILQENITYGNTSIVTGDTVFTINSVNATNTGYSVGVAEGVYFIRGTFVDVPNAQIVLDPYDNEPSFRVGYDIVEEIVNSDQDPKLNDNAKGFTNYAAPGADRLKIQLKLTKKQLTDNEDTSFVELVRIDQGEIKKLQNKSQYSLIRDYFAERTFEESGNYAVDSFNVDIVDTLNNETGNGGLFREDEVTDEGNTPSENLMGVRVSAGTAYVKGYDIDLVGSTIIDVEKPRTTKPVGGALIPFALGSLVRVNNVHGTPYLNIGDTAAGGANSTNTNIIELYSERRNAAGNTNTGDAAAAGLATKVGEARVYWWGVTDDSYKDGSTSWDLYLYDIQTYTKLTLANTYSNTEAPVTSYVRGLSSGATGYISVVNSNEYSLTQTSGRFLIGEQVIINENPVFKTGITAMTIYNTTDIKSVFQDSDGLNSALSTNFIADTILYEQELERFGVKDQLVVSGGNTGRVSGRNFQDGEGGIKVGSILKYQTGSQDPTYNVVTAIRADGTAVTLASAPASINNVNANAVSNGTYNFSLLAPRIRQYGSNGLYATMPVENIASVDLANADLTITKQITGKSVTSNSITLEVADAVDVSAGITSVFFETFDAERYTITDNSGTPIALNSGNFTLGANGHSVTFSGLSNGAVTVQATLKKKGVTNKTKDFARSNKLSVVRTTGATSTVGLTTSKFYGTRIEDDQISLNVPDVVNVRAIYESTNTAAPVLDKLTFATGLALDQNAIIGEKLVGQDSRAVAQVVNSTANSIEYVKLNTNNFSVGESVKFKDSSIESVIQEITPGSYNDRTANYRLDKGHRHQFCDYSRIVRRKGSAVPSRQLMIVFDSYKVGSNNTGDIFTVNSYAQDRFTSDIPTLPNGLRCSDLLDFRPRVKEFDLATAASPFAFNSRQYEYNYKYVVSPDETSFLGYSYYLPRIDLVSINRLGEVEVIKGEPADIPQSPVLGDDAMEVAQVLLPAYLYNATKDPKVLLRDNRRFTMRDIGKLEDRIENLEEVTSLSLLELSTKTLDVTDANGLSRFKSGFIVSDFRDKSLMDPRLSTVDISAEGATCIAPVDFWSMNAQLALDPGIDASTTDISQNLKLLDPNIQKTGDLLTLKYDEVDWLNQPHATNVENVNPFNVIVFVGGVVLDPASDNWVRTIYINDHRTESTGAKWKHKAKVTKDVDKKTEFETYKKGGGRGETGRRAFTTTTITTTTKYKRKLTGPSREFDYVEDVKVSGEADPWMRSRNVYFNANGLRPYSRHYLYLDSQQVDIVPKLCEIEMQSGTFRVYEDADVFDSRGLKIGVMRIQKPNHKFGDTSRPDIGAGLGSPAVLVEEYQVDPYDRNRPGPGDTYSPTSKLINFGVRVLSTGDKFYGYVKKGAKVIGQTSGAVCTITRAELVSDNWGDIIANFFFRNPNTVPRPPIRVTSGTKTVKVTAVPPNTVVLPGSTVFASEAIGAYSGSGTILTQETSRVSVRNPPKPRRKKTEVEVKVKAPHRDPLAQSFTVDGKGCFLTSFDLFFATKDPGAKIFVELRTMELGTPTSFLVQDYTQVSLNPADININEANPFEPVPTRVRFPSPVYLEADTEYAIVILSPASDGYEMWTATMGKKTVRTTNLPDVQNVVVTKQYIGGSLFKSQNGTIWTPSQYQDLTFKLYKAKFVPSGAVTFFNSDVLPKGDNSAALEDNPIEGLPRKLKLPISGTLDAGVIAGVKVAEGATAPSINGIVENLGGPAVSGTGNVSIASSGTGYKPSISIANVDLVSLTGKGTGAKASLTIDSFGNVKTVNITTVGTGYVEGETVGIVTSTMAVSKRAGKGARFTLTGVGNADTLYLTNVQGENFTNSLNLFYYGDPTNETTRETAGVTINGTSTLIDDIYSGNVFRIKQHNHAHHGGNNKISVEDILPDTGRTTITGNFGETDAVVAVADRTLFETFEGITTSRGYALLNNEIISYNAITAGANNTGTLSIDARAVGNSVKSSHTTGEFIQPYEVNGVSLTRINTSHDIPATYYTDQNSNLDNYFLEFDRTAASPTPRGSGSGMINFESQKGFGGNTVGISQNYQFSNIEPMFNIITPGKGTSSSALIRTISGTSAGGNEVSFIDQGFEPVTLNKLIQFDTPRMVASRVNEVERLGTLPNNKSLSMRVEFASTDENLSPVMDVQNATFILGRNKSNAPVKDYVDDSRANLIENDPHGAIFVTKQISLSQPATSLKVYIAANRQEDADFRVLYQLIKADSSEIEQKFIPFPGYDNLIDDDGDGFGDRTIDPEKSSGRADAFVAANDKEGFSEYQFSVNNVDQFTAFAIKVVMSSTNESTPVKLKDFRAIALA